MMMLTRALLALALVLAALVLLVRRLPAGSANALAEQEAKEEAAAALVACLAGMSAPARRYVLSLSAESLDVALRTAAAVQTTTTVGGTGNIAAPVSAQPEDAVVEEATLPSSLGGENPATLLWLAAVFFLARTAVLAGTNALVRSDALYRFRISSRPILDTQHEREAGWMPSVFASTVELLLAHRLIEHLFELAPWDTVFFDWRGFVVGILVHALVVEPFYCESQAALPSPQTFCVPA